MKRTIMLVTILIHLFFSSNLFAFDSWTKEQAFTEVGYLALHTIDWGQTLHISDNPNEFRETNFLLGEHPSRGNVTEYFIATGIGHILITHILPTEWRKYWQWSTIALEIGCTANNYKLGISATF